ncbi:unnamed protein product, partial [Phaeothamnion confervicola]
RHSGAVQSTEPGISRFRVWSYGPSRNDRCAVTSSPRFRGSILRHPDGSAPAAGRRRRCSRP